MSVVDPTSDWRKFVKPKLPLGSSSGSRGDVVLCGPACIKCGNDPGDDWDGEPLSDGDLTDVVRRARALLQQRGPCQEEDLWGLVDVWQARLVRAAFGGLAPFLAKQPGFHYRRQGEHALLCYVDPEGEEVRFPHSSSCLPPGGGPAPSKGGLAKEGSAEGKRLRRGRRGSRSGSSSSGSYKSAVEELDEDGGAEQKKPRRQRPPSDPTRYVTKAVQTDPTVRDSEAQTDEPNNSAEELSNEDQSRGWGQASLIRAKQASMKEARGRDVELALDKLRCELEGILAKFEEVQCQYRQGTPPTPPTSGQPSEAEEDGQSGSPAGGGGGGGGGVASAASVEEERGEGAKEGIVQFAVEVLEERPRLKLRCCCPQCRASAPAANGSSDAELVLQRTSKLVEVYQPPETFATIWDIESTSSSCGATVGSSPPKSKSEAQIAKIVKLLKRKMPEFTEAEIRRQVDEVRTLRGGFSNMMVRNIVALVMGHMRNMAASGRAAWC